MAERTPFAASMVDPLTGLGQIAAGWRKCLKWKWRRAERSAQWLAIPMADIDALKAHNDPWDIWRETAAYCGGPYPGRMRQPAGRSYSHGMEARSFLVPSAGARWRSGHGPAERMRQAR